MVTRWFIIATLAVKEQEGVPHAVISHFAQ